MVDGLDTQLKLIFLWYLDLAVLVANNKDKTEMNPNNLALVFSPNLVPPSLEKSFKVSKEMSKQMSSKDIMKMSFKASLVTGGFIQSAIEWR